MIIASVSTIPSRLNKMRDTLISLKNQTKSISKIEVNLPKVCKRTGEEYPTPDWLVDSELKDFVEVFEVEDLGPITKIYETIQRHKDCFIMTIDDDIIYPSLTVETLWKCSEKLEHNCAVGISGFNFVKFASQVVLNATFNFTQTHVIEGYCGVLYPPQIWKDDFNSYIKVCLSNPDAKFSDDVILSNYLARSGIHRYIAITKKYGRKVFWAEKDKTVLEYGLEQDALQKQTGGHQDRYARLLDWLNSHKLLYLKPIVIG